MKTCFVTDLVTLTESQRVVDADGFLTAPATIAKAGNIQSYLASELDLPGDPKRIVRLYRPREEVAKAAPTFAKRPITNGHPKGKRVNSENYRDVSVGESDSLVAMDGDLVNTVVNVRDKKAVLDLMSDKSGMSCGYRFAFDDSKKTTPEGAAVDGWMTDIIGNHIAIVERGRGGPECVVADDHGGTMAMKKIAVDGLTLELDETAAAVVERLQAANVKLAADAESALEAGREAEATAVAADAENKTHLAKIAELSTEIATLKAAGPKEPGQAQIEKAAEERALVIGDSIALTPELKPAGKTVAQIRREALTVGIDKHPGVKTVVDAALAGVAIDKATDDNIRVTFAAAVAVAKGDKRANDDVAAMLLGAGGGKGKDSGSVAADEDRNGGLIGQQAYAWRLTHPQRKQHKTTA